MNINKIRLSGQTYDIQDPNASKTVELTQAEYDALVEAGTLDLTALYIIPDATMVNIDDYVLKSENALNPVEILSHYEIREANTAQALGTNFSTNKVYVTRRPSKNSSGNNNIRLRINTAALVLFMVQYNFLFLLIMV